MTRDALLAVLGEARTLADAGVPAPEVVHDLVLRILAEAEGAPEVGLALRDVAAGRALLRFTDAPLAIEFQAGEGRIHAEEAEPKGKGPKVDATAATWLGLIGGTLRPWLAFTRGAVVCRAGLTELRWMQQVSERLQRAYADAQRASSGI